MPTTGVGWRELREHRDLSPEGLAALTGLTLATILKIERGEQVNRSTRTLVAAALGLPVFGEPAPAAAA